MNCLVSGVQEVKYFLVAEYEHLIVCSVDKQCYRCIKIRIEFHYSKVYRENSKLRGGYRAHKVACLSSVFRCSTNCMLSSYIWRAAAFKFNYKIKYIKRSFFIYTWHYARLIKYLKHPNTIKESDEDLYLFPTMFHMLMLIWCLFVEEGQSKYSMSLP